MPRGKPKPRKGKGMLAWRSRQKTGAIMKPSTFESIKRKAAASGASNPEAVAGRAYWNAAKKKYKQSHHSAADGSFLASRRSKFNTG